MAEEKIYRDWEYGAVPNSTQFWNFLQRGGFSGCPVCGNKTAFTWPHATKAPAGDILEMRFHIPGTTTLPGKPEAKEPYPAPLVMMICDRCTHIMLFSAAMLAFKEGQPDGSPAEPS